MTESKHTAGPWTPRKSGLGPFVTAPSPSGSESEITIAQCAHPVDAFHSHQREANARLIAAAPELLAALCRFVSLRDSGLLIESDGYMGMVLDEALAAIAKAEGRP